MCCGLEGDGEDQKSWVGVYDMKKKKAPLVALENMPEERYLAASWQTEQCFMTFGLTNIRLYTFNEGEKTLTSELCSLGDCPAYTQYVADYAFDKAYCVSGDSMGNLNIWDGIKAIKSIQAHQGAVLAMNPVIKDKLYTGGADGFIKVFNDQMEEIEKIDVNQLTKFPAAIFSLDISEEGEVLVGTKGGEVKNF